MMWIKLIFGGLGRHSVEAIAAAIILAATSATVAASLMVVEGARNALIRAVHRDRPDVVQIKSRFNRALFETPRSGNLPPLTIPVYEPLIDPVELEAAAGNSELVKRQSLFRNVVSGDSFLNIYIFGIDPDVEREVSIFALARGRFLRREDRAAAVLDEASARALGTSAAPFRFARRMAQTCNSQSSAFSTEWTCGVLRPDRLKPLRSCRTRRSFRAVLS
jgi:hypothetical protein